MKNNTCLFYIRDAGGGHVWRDLTGISLLRSPQFICFFVLRFTWTSCSSTLKLHIVNAAHNIGESGDRANSLPGK